MHPPNNDATALDAIARKTKAISRLIEAESNLLAAQHALYSEETYDDAIEIGMRAARQSVRMLILKINELQESTQLAPESA